MGLFDGSGKVLQTYATSLVYVNSSLLAEESSVTINRNTNSQQMITLHGGYAGESSGAEIVNVTVQSNIPSSGFEFDPGQFMLGSRYVEFDIRIGSETIAFEGQITSDNFAHAVGSSAALSFSARGKFSKYSAFLS